MTALMSKAQDIYYSPTRNFAKEVEDTAARDLNSYQVLSLSAMSSIIGISMYRIEKAISQQSTPVSRGHLNPAHLSMLKYMRASGKANRHWIKEMTGGGTSVITIAMLTGLSESTIRRARR